jgi:hypothetical protein
MRRSGQSTLLVTSPKASRFTIPPYLFLAHPCSLQILEGDKNMNPPSKNEMNTLKGKPASFRLSCCARVKGNVACKTKVN